jgi:hypothetical protein
MSGPVILHGEEAEKVWATFWKEALPHGQKLAKVCRTGTAAVLALGLPKGILKPGQAVHSLDEGMRKNLIKQFEETGDRVTAEFLKSDRPGRVIAFYGEASFLLNLDLTKDPTKRESYSIEPGSLDADRIKDPNGGAALAAKLTQLGRLREFDMLETKIRDLKRAEALEHGELRKLTESVAQEEVDLLETIMPGHEITFGELFLAWAKETSPPPAYGADRKVRKIIADQLTSDIEGEIRQRGLDRWITDATGGSETLGTGIRVKGTEPVHALASLMSSKLYDLLDTLEKFGLPSGRMLSQEDIAKAIKEMILPPLVTPNNIEVAMMSLARFSAFTESDRSADVRSWLKHLGKSRLAYFEDSQFGALLDMLGFGSHWRSMAFARLELGHKLAAALMFTDAPESVQAPWLAWSLILPDGLLGEVDIRRVWCLGDRPAVLLVKLGDHVGTLGLHVFKPREDGNLGIDPGPYNPDLGEKIPKTRAAFEAMGKEYEEKFLRTLPMLQNLIRGVCLALSDPAEWRKGDYYGRPSGSEIKKASKHKELPVGERYVLGHPVQIDLREEVLEHVRTGRVGGGSPTKLFLVRGHHRRQAHGPGHQLRKTIWVEPFWKGPEDARVLLRPHQA